VSQAALTGESLPIRKTAAPTAVPEDELTIGNVCYLGTDVVSGAALAVVAATAGRTRFGEIAVKLTSRREISSFDKGVVKFTWLMIRFMLIMVPLVFLLNGLRRGDWGEAFLFALAVAVGLTPEMLPMMVTVNLAKGALVMSRKKVIVKRLNSIQNFGAMDVLCTDKTGTLTEGKVTLVRHSDITGEESDQLFEYAWLNSRFETGFKNPLDAAVLRHDPSRTRSLAAKYKKIDEIPFDFERRRMSVAVTSAGGECVLITKGAFEEVIEISTQVLIRGQKEKLSEERRSQAILIADRLSAEGYRLLALAVKILPPEKTVCSVAEERDLTLLGFLAFYDPPKESAAEAIKEVERLGIEVKILTGDNEIVTRKICEDVGIVIRKILTGKEIEKMSDRELEIAVSEANVFDRLDPLTKERLVRSLQRRGRVVGFLGDGINDAPALRAADVGISVQGATDIAKESSDIILLKKSLLILMDGVLEGRRVFGNIEKYIKMAASSNFGNMLSVVGASLFLPFLPMLPLQIVINNLLYDFSQVAIPTDRVDEEYLARPRQWKLDMIEKFVVFLGPVSSLFDYCTFFVLLMFFQAGNNPELFRTGWFLESVITQIVVIQVIRTRKIPFLQSSASRPLTFAALLVSALAIGIVFSPYNRVLGFAPPPPTYWLALGGILIGYLFSAQIVKNQIYKRFAGL
jgi:Mg2+-importing ATPase